MALATNALTTVARVKSASTVSCTDARLEMLINATSNEIENFTGRTLGWAKVGTIEPDYYKGSGTAELWLRRMPIVTVTRVRIDGTEITDFWRTARHDALGCLLRGAANCETAWQRSAGIWPDLTGDYCYREDALSWNIDICGQFGYVLPQYANGTYVHHNPTGGDSNLPASIEEACIREVLRRESMPVGGVKREKTPGGWEIERFGPVDVGANSLSDETRAALAPYCLPARWFV